MVKFPSLAVLAACAAALNWARSAIPDNFPPSPGSGDGSLPTFCFLTNGPDDVSKDGWIPVTPLVFCNGFDGDSAGADVAARGTRRCCGRSDVDLRDFLNAESWALNASDMVLEWTMTDVGMWCVRDRCNGVFKSVTLPEVSDVLEKRTL